MRAAMPPSPDAAASPADVAAADLAACRVLLRDGSRTFLAASRLLPRRVRDPACVLYAFCRQADDAVDLDASPRAGLDRLRERLHALYRGTPRPWPADRALAAVVARFDIPRSLFDALFEGFAWDADGRRYDTLDELMDYAARVAGTVGAMMALLMGARSPQALARATDLGVAMQLSNIARDVGEDARNGRVYLPLQWLREAGIEPDALLARPAFSAPLGTVVQRLLQVADALYARVDDGIARLPASCRPGINAARRLYAEIGHEVRRRGGDSVAWRAVVSPGRKLRVLLGALPAAAFARRGAVAPPLAATQFLVEGAAVAGASRRDPPRWWRLDARVVGVIELFERIERRSAAL
jgi:phytoene synthase